MFYKIVCAQVLFIDRLITFYLKREIKIVLVTESRCIKMNERDVR